jgi:hypothetical protein
MTTKERSINRTVVTGLLKNAQLRTTVNNNKLCTFTLCVIELARDGSQKTQLCRLRLMEWPGRENRQPAGRFESLCQRQTPELFMGRQTERAEAIQTADRVRERRTCPQPAIPPQFRRYPREANHR